MPLGPVESSQRLAQLRIALRQPEKKTCATPKRYHLFVHQSAPAKDTHIEDDDDGSFPKFYSTLQSNQRHRSKPSLGCNLVAAGSLYPFQVARAKAFNALSPLEVAQSLWRGKKRIKRLIITRCSWRFMSFTMGSEIQHRNYDKLNHKFHLNAPIQTLLQSLESAMSERDKSIQPECVLLWEMRLI